MRGADTKPEWALPPIPLREALVAYRIARDNEEWPGGGGWVPSRSNLHPRGLLLHDDGRLTWAEAGLSKIASATWPELAFWTCAGDPEQA